MRINRRRLLRDLVATAATGYRVAGFCTGALSHGRSASSCRPLRAGLTISFPGLSPIMSPANTAGRLPLKIGPAPAALSAWLRRSRRRLTVTRWSCPSRGDAWLRAGVQSRPALRSLHRSRADHPAGARRAGSAGRQTDAGQFGGGPYRAHPRKAGRAEILQRRLPDTAASRRGDDAATRGPAAGRRDPCALPRTGRSRARTARRRGRFHDRQHRIGQRLYLANGDLRALAITSPSDPRICRMCRLSPKSAFPDIGSWHGARWPRRPARRNRFSTAGTPWPMKRSRTTTFARASKKLDYDVCGGSAASYTDFFKQDIETYRQLAAATGLKEESAACDPRSDGDERRSTR